MKFFADRRFSARIALVAVPVLTLVWWAAMYWSGDLPAEVLRGECEYLLMVPWVANVLFVVVAGVMIVLFFGVLRSNRRLVERNLYALMWPLLSLVVYTMLGSGFAPDSLSDGMSGMSWKDFLVVHFYMVPVSFVMGSWEAIVVGLGCTLIFSEWYARRIRSERIAEFRGEDEESDLAVVTG